MTSKEESENRKVLGLQSVQHEIHIFIGAC